MASSCDTCGAGLSMVQRARGRTRCDNCTAQAKASLDRAYGEYFGALESVIRDGQETGPSVDRLRQLDVQIAAAGGSTSDRKAAFYRSHLDVALADEVLTSDEERSILDVGAALYGDDDEGQRTVLAEYRTSLYVAMVNDGRLPEMTEARMVLKRNEVLHLEEPAALMKEVVQREYQAGSRGVSFRVMKGVSYRVGNTRGKMVEVGRTLEPIDQGSLCITSLRAVFTGERKTIETPYAKLLDINVYADAIQFHQTGRQTPSMFKVSSGPMVAAAVNAAMQKLL